MTGMPSPSNTCPFTLTDCMTDCTEATSACMGVRFPIASAEAIKAEKRTLCDEFFRKSFFIRLNLKLTISLLFIFYIHCFI